MTKIALIGNNNSSIVFEIFKNLKFQRTFSFSTDINAKFNEFARRLGFNVIIINENFFDYQAEIEQALLDFKPDLIFDFESGLDLNINRIFIKEDELIIIYSDKIHFIGDLANAKKFISEMIQCRPQF
jgi:hypothetical protein